MNSSSSLTVIPEVESLLQRSSDMHTLPVVVLEVQRLMDAPDTSAQDIANLLARDPALAVRILKLANSPYYGFRRRIGNLTQAIVILGFQAVRNLMLTASVMDSFGADDHVDYARFWGDAVSTAVTANELARLANTPHADEAYIAGLLHDVGRLLLAQNVPHLLEEVQQRIDDGEESWSAHRAVLGVHHSEIGHRIAASWGLPPTLSDAIRDCHQPRSGEGIGSPADVLCLARILSRALLGGSEPLWPVPEGLSLRLEYDSPKLTRWIDQVATALQNAEEFFEILGLGPVRLQTQ